MESDDDLNEVWAEILPERPKSEPVAAKPRVEEYVVVATDDDGAVEETFIVRGSFPYADLHAAIQGIAGAAEIAGRALEIRVPAAPVVETPAQLVEAITDAWVRASEVEAQDDEEEAGPTEVVEAEGIRFTVTNRPPRGRPRGPDDEPNYNF